MISRSSRLPRDALHSISDIVRRHRIQVVLSEQRMPGMTGVELLARVRLISPNSTRVLLTGFSDVEAIGNAVNEGEIFRYITKPWRNDELLQVVRQAAEIAKSAQNEGLEGDSASSTPRNKILTLVESIDCSALMAESLNTQTEVVAARTIDHAAEMLREDKPSVLLVELGGSDQARLVAFIKTVKMMYPTVVTMVTSRQADAAMLVGLINEGQVYRYLPFPVRPGNLKLNLMSALKYNRRLRHTPGLTSRHAVAHIADPTERRHSRRLLQRLNATTARFLRWIGSSNHAGKLS